MTKQLTVCIFLSANTNSGHPDCPVGGNVFNWRHGLGSNPSSDVVLETTVLVSRRLEDKELVLVLTKKSWELDFFRIYKTGDSHDAGPCPPPAIVTKTSLFASYRKPLPSAEKAAVPLTSIVSSYLAFVQLILDGTEVGTLWRIVKDTARQHQLSVFWAMWVCSSGLIEQGCLTSFCVISCWQSATCNRQWQWQRQWQWNEQYEIAF